MNKFIGYFVLIIGILLIVAGCGPKVDRLEVSKLFSDGMVLQRESPIRVWGWGTPRAKVKVSFNGQITKTVVEQDGKWKTELASQDAGGPYEMTVNSGPKSITIGDVLVGEVWLASGQSNMQMTVDRCNDSDQEIASSANDNIRQFHVYRFISEKPLENPVDPSGESQEYANKWESASPATTGHFSAAAYYFARELQRELNVPVGIVHASWGGTEIECWMSDEALSSNEMFAEHSPAKGDDISDPWSTTLYNGMLKPVIPYTIRGAIWYQGESNARYPEEYDDLMETMIESWRTEWAQGDFPFLYVQLAGYDREGWPNIRQSQTKVLEFPNTGMAVALDIGEKEDIHPKNKQEVGHRLVLNALKLAYGKDVLNNGPMLDTVIKDGDKFILNIKYAGDSLAVPEGQTLGGFEILDPKTGGWVAASAEFRSRNQLSVWNDKVRKPAAVRYGWHSWAPEANLYNTQNGKIWLPAVPFLED